MTEPQCDMCGHERVHHGVRDANGRWLDQRRCWVWVKQKRPPHGCPCDGWTEGGALRAVPADPREDTQAAWDALIRFEWGRNEVGLCSWCGVLRGTSDDDAHEADCPLVVVRRALRAAPAAPEPGIDVERLAQAIRRLPHLLRQLRPFEPETVSDLADEIAAEYRLVGDTAPEPVDFGWMLANNDGTGDSR